MRKGKAAAEALSKDNRGHSIIECKTEKARSTIRNTRGNTQTETRKVREINNIFVRHYYILTGNKGIATRKHFAHVRGTQVH